MDLPEQLRAAIDQQIRGGEISDVLRAAREISERYRRGEPTRLKSRAQRLAYLLARMPATYAATHRALTEAAPRLPEVRTVLDLGGGPGTAMWAAADLFPSLQRVTVVERDVEMAKLGRALAAQSRQRAVQDAEWRVEDMARTEVRHDLVSLAYAIGELAPTEQTALLRRSWEGATSLAIIEPGTPRGFAAVLQTRTWLLAHGAQLAAPCPHLLECPMAAAGDWCHFAQRVERTSLHRLAKGGALGYEDEKFSYVIAMHAPAQLPHARIVRHPLKHPGHVQLTLCTAGRLERETVAKSDKERYRAARKAEWGDGWE